MQSTTSVTTLFGSAVLTNVTLVGIVMGEFEIDVHNTKVLILLSAATLATELYVGVSQYITIGQKSLYFNSLSQKVKPYIFSESQFRHNFQTKNHFDFNVIK